MTAGEWLVAEGWWVLRFALEASERLRVVGNVIRQELQSHKAVKLYVFSFIDDTHPAATELFDDAVVRDSLP